MSQPPLTVGFAGPPGAGKSALIAALHARLPDALTVSADDFPAPHAMPFDALESWIEAGADFGCLEVSEFVDALATLRDGRAYRGRTIAPGAMLLVEAPLGRAHPAIAPLIDRLIWIDTPLDVALARNLIAWRSQPEGPPPEWVDAYLDQYLGAVRRVLVAQRAAVTKEADLIVDGMLGVDALADHVEAWLAQ
jgi:uridine kinase